MPRADGCSEADADAGAEATSRSRIGSSCRSQGTSTGAAGVGSDRSRRSEADAAARQIWTSPTTKSQGTSTGAAGAPQMWSSPLYTSRCWSRIRSRDRFCRRLRLATVGPIRTTRSYGPADAFLRTFSMLKMQSIQTIRTSCGCILFKRTRRRV